MKKCSDRFHQNSQVSQPYLDKCQHLQLRFSADCLHIELDTIWPSKRLAFVQIIHTYVTYVNSQTWFLGKEDRRCVGEMNSRIQAIQNHNPKTNSLEFLLGGHEKANVVMFPVNQFGRHAWSLECTKSNHIKNMTSYLPHEQTGKPREVFLVVIFFICSCSGLASCIIFIRKAGIMWTGCRPG